ncbi:kelch domain-containing protein 2-like isoform X1 [Schistocerca cancellata]|uniref:kelch domain-containing protein 2-like isoform X1 n=2 Tax=Schistocerca TaxID=7008 RepID=UPI0021197C39|nr:kelch domain-containing protein 2-like isoform X1 [Schistocerca cancellata]
MSAEEVYTVPYDRIHRRSGHVAVVYKNYVVVWGGYTEHVQRTSTSQIRTEYFPTDEIWIYDSNTELWDREVTTGEHPPRNSGACGVILKQHLYVFGGFALLAGYTTDTTDDRNNNTNGLYRLDLTSLTWEQLHPSGKPEPAACDKLVGWEYEGRLYFFGGFGPPPSYDPPFKHVIDPSTSSLYERGWSNQLVCYCPETDSWSWPKTHGRCPEPRAAHAADRTGSRLYLFGGRYRGRRMSDLHCLDLDTMTWSGDLNNSLQCAKPCGRSWHSLTFISPQRAILYGGLNQMNTILNDCWVLEVPDIAWSELKDIPSIHKRKPRLWHKAPLVPTGEIVVIGGYAKNIFGTDEMFAGKDHAEELILLNFTPKSLRRLCVDFVLSLVDDPRIKPELDTLPRSLCELLRRRLEQDQVERRARSIYYEGGDDFSTTPTVNCGCG